jgi:hypothetical protein
MSGCVSVVAAGDRGYAFLFDGLLRDQPLNTDPVVRVPFRVCLDILEADDFIPQGKLTAPAPYPRSNNNPPAMTNLPVGQPSTPTTVGWLGMNDGDSAQFLPLLPEITRTLRASSKPLRWKPSPGARGAEFSFYGGHGLERAIQRIGNERHSDYISYSPNNSEEGGFHHIAVDVTGHPEVRKVQTRPGYWVAASQ